MNVNFAQFFCCSAKRDNICTIYHSWTYTPFFFSSSKLMDLLILELVFLGIVRIGFFLCMIDERGSGDWNFSGF